MVTRRQPYLNATLACLLVLVLLGASACSAKKVPLNETQLNDLAARYAAAWSSQNPEELASCFAENGSLTINTGAPSVGRAAIAAMARGVMAAFPDMVVKMDSVSPEGGRAVFRWTWTGTNTGPGGTGKPLRINGYEEWTIGDDGLIEDSKGHFDEAEYQRQLGAGGQD